MVFDLFYLPSLEFFSAIHGAEELIINPNDPYVRQSYRNRTRILLANKTERLSIPVLEARSIKPYKEIKIDYSQKWMNVHLRGIQSAYGKAPFFEHFYSDLERVYLQQNKYLLDLNWKILTLCLKFLGWNVKMVTTSSAIKNEDCDDIRGLINAKQSYEERELYLPHPYRQIFGADFVPNLCVLDLLFCEGVQASKILALSKKSN
jgi:hypothetical protein